jgi:hypothetical protein
MKNSEWGAVAYLSQSQYGLNGTNIAINNVSLNNTIETIYAVTGCASTAENYSDAGEVNTVIEDLNKGKTENVATWTQVAGTKASSTGTIYGIYDLSGGTTEMSASYTPNGSNRIEYCGASIKSETNKKYVMLYTAADDGVTDNSTARRKNYNANNKIGDAIKEVSEDGASSTGWYGDCMYFIGYNHPAIARGAQYWSAASAGLFSSAPTDVLPTWYRGFRPVLVAK